VENLVIRSRHLARSVVKVTALLFGLSLYLPTLVYADSDGIQAEPVVDLSDLLTEAAQKHPAIQSARASADAAAERPSQAGALPDPIIGVDVANFRLDDPTLGSSPMAGILFRFKQGVPFPGKLSHRKRRATAEARVSAEVAAAVASDVTVRVKSRYWALSGAVAIERITAQNVAVLEELIDVANSRFAVGMGAQQDVLQLQAALSELSAQLIQRQQESRNAQRELQVAVGREAGSEPINTARFEDTYAPDPTAQLVLGAAQFNPDLAVQVARVLAAEESVAEARFDRLPDFALGGGYRLRQPIDNGISDGGDMFFLALDISLPLYSGAKQNRRLAETRSRLVAAQYAEKNLRLQIGLVTRNLNDEIHRVRNQIELYQDEVIQQERFALDAAVSDYSVANVDFQAVFANWQALLRDEIKLEKLTATLGARFAELEFVVGRDLQ